MCGIAGIVDFEKPIEKSLLDRMNQKMAHRGPDDSGIFIHQTVGLAHHRLSIIDLSSNGHQPMVSACGCYSIVLNGEIYNHKEIRIALNDKYTFKSHTDTETLLYGFIEYGERIFSMLNGMFSMSILDMRKNELFVVRDQLGVKPLYYYRKDEVFLFASELKILLEYEALDKTINYNALVDYVNLLWSPGEKTPFAHVKKILPGHYIKTSTTDVSQFEYIQYYDIPFTGEYTNSKEEEVIVQLQEKIENAVHRQLQSDVPVGFFLSGGVDSSAIVAIAKKLYPHEKFICYTIVNSKQEEGFSSDLYYARMVARHLDLPLREVNVNDDIESVFDKMVYQLDEPMSDAAALNVMHICRAAKADGVKVLLGGTAGDDLFSGYRRHQLVSYEQLYKLIPSFLLRVCSTILNVFNAGHPFIRRAIKVLKGAHKPTLERMFGYFIWGDMKRNNSLFEKSTLLNATLSNYNPSIYFRKLWQRIKSENSLLNKVLYWELKTYLPDNNLNYTDKMSMQFGVEVRVPFLDLELVNFSTTINPRYKLKRGETKYVFKKAMEMYLPKEVIYRSKTGFGGPVRNWVQHELQGRIKEVLSRKSVSARGVFNPEEVTRLVEDTKKNKIDGAYTIWSLLAIESWMKQFVDEKK